MVDQMLLRYTRAVALRRVRARDTGRIKQRVKSRPHERDHFDEVMQVDVWRQGPRVSVSQQMSQGSTRCLLHCMKHGGFPPHVSQHHFKVLRLCGHEATVACMKARIIIDSPTGEEDQVEELLLLVLRQSPPPSL